MKIRFTLFAIFLLTALSSFGQISDSLSDVHTDIDCYYKVSQLQGTVDLQNTLIEKMIADTVDWKAKYDRQTKTADSINYENNALQSQVKNVITNCQTSLNRKSTWETIFKYTALIAVPVAILSTTILIAK